MLCSKCGVEIPEGKLLCPGCGAEIQIVPDFDIDIEEKIELSENDIEGAIEGDPAVRNPDAVLAADTRDLNPDDTNSLVREAAPVKEMSHAERAALRRKQKAKKRRKAVLIILPIAAVLGIALLLNLKNTAAGTYEKHMERAAGYMEEEDYLSASGEYLEALEKAEGDREAALGAAEALYRSGEGEKALQYLRLLTEADPEDAQACRLILMICEDRGNIDTCKSLMRSLSPDAVLQVTGLAPDQESAARWGGYLVDPPVFSEAGGTYENDVVLTFKKGEDTDRVFITVNGSIPDKNSDEVTGDVVLTEGTHKITAVSISRTGFASEPVTEEFVIDSGAPEPPVVYPESGTYEEPVNITVSANEGLKIYYSSYGKKPDETRYLYEGELPMRFGKSTYHFVTVDEKGKESEPVTMEYDLKFNGAIGQDEAVGFVVAALMENGTIKDPKGTLPDGTRYDFSCKTCYKSGSRLYYIISGKHLTGGDTEDPEGNVIYAMDYKTLDLYKGKRNANGELTFELL